MDRLSRADVDKMKNVLNLLSDNADAIKAFTTSIKDLSKVRSPPLISGKSLGDSSMVSVAQLHPIVQAAASIVLLPLQVKYSIDSARDAIFTPSFLVASEQAQFH